MNKSEKRQREPGDGASGVRRWYQERTNHMFLSSSSSSWTLLVVRAAANPFLRAHMAEEAPEPTCAWVFRAGFPSLAAHWTSLWTPWGGLQKVECLCILVHLPLSGSGGYQRLRSTSLGINLLLENVLHASDFVLGSAVAPGELQSRKTEAWRRAISHCQEVDPVRPVIAAAPLSVII